MYSIPYTRAGLKPTERQAQVASAIELLNNNSHGLLPPGGLVSPSGGFLSLLCDQDNQDPVVRCHCL